jgi:hypothetical protein
MMEKHPSGLVPAVLALLCSLPVVGHAGGAGVLVVRTSAQPEKIKPGEKSTIAIDSRDGFQRPLAGVSIKITADTGFFEANHERIVRGATDQRGEFKTVWQSDVRTDPGVQVFTIIASKSGYLGRYPLSAYVTLESPSEQKLDAPGEPQPGQDATSFDGSDQP